MGPEGGIIGSEGALPPATNVASTPPPATTPSQPPPPAAVGPAPSAYTRQIVQNLTGMDFSKGITPEQAELWKQEFQKLVKEGASSVPAVREFLAKNVDLGFEGVQGGNQLGAASLRMALFDALKQIGGPEAIGLAAQTLQTTGDPREIAILARNLDQMAPEQYREVALAAAREAMAQAANNLQAVDTGPLFEVIAKYGGAGSAGELLQAAGKWNYYGPIALASLPEGAGVPFLAQIAEDPDGTYRSSSRFALQMLAQLAPQYPDAAKSLVEQARAGKVPDTAWYGIASALGGTQMLYGNAQIDPFTPPPTAADPKSYSIPFNRQQYRSYNLSGSWTPDQLQRQIALIDQIRAANASAGQTLEPIRAALASRLNP